VLCLLYQHGLIEINYTEHQRAYTTATTANGLHFLNTCNTTRDFYMSSIIEAEQYYLHILSLTPISIVQILFNNIFHLIVHLPSSPAFREAYRYLEICMHQNLLIFMKKYNIYRIVIFCKIMDLVLI
jgi:hypothetical protein